MFFNVMAKFRIRAEDLKTAKNIIRYNKHKYDNLSHFYRVAVLRLIREHTNNKKKIEVRR